jgi:hypothetical protein
VSRGDIKGVSVRSALFALRKAGLLSDAEFKQLDLDWKKRKAARGLDAYGKKPPVLPAATASDQSACCWHDEHA